MKEGVKGKSHPRVMFFTLGILMIICAVLAGIRFIGNHRANQRKAQVEKTINACMKAYEDGDLEECLSYTDLKKHSKDFSKFMLQKIIVSTASQSGQDVSIISYVFEKSTRSEERMEELLLAAIRGYKIKEVKMDPEDEGYAKAVLELKLPTEMTASGMQGYMLQGLESFGKTYLSGIRDLFSGKGLQAIKDLGQGYLDDLAEMCFDMVQEAMTGAKTSSERYTVELYEDDGEWVIKLEELIDQMLQDQE